LPLRRATKAFTLIEIALSLGVIAFALVAIIGILPAGLQVQRDNREETIINQEGTYLLEAIRNGAEGLDDLSNRVRLIVISNVVDGLNVQVVNNALTEPNRLTAKQIVGLLSTPSDLTNEVYEVRAIMYSGAGSAGTMGTELDFQYQVVIRNFPYTNYGPGAQKLLDQYFRDVRVDVRWPVLNADKVGIGRQNFRGQFSGVMNVEPDPRFPTGLWFVRQ
jgi:type II secretory pathway pseudopilin PulG